MKRPNKKNPEDVSSSAQFEGELRKAFAGQLGPSQFTRSMVPEVLRLYEPCGPVVPPMAHGEEEYYRFELCHNERWLVTSVACGWRSEEGLRIESGTGAGAMLATFETELASDVFHCLGNQLGSAAVPRLAVGSWLKLTLRNRSMAPVKRPDILWVYGLRLMPDDFDLPPEPPAHLNPQPVPLDTAEALAAIDEITDFLNARCPEPLCAICASPGPYTVYWHSDHHGQRLTPSLFCCEVHVEAGKKKLSGGVPSGQFGVLHKPAGFADKMRQLIRTSRETVQKLSEVQEKQQVAHDTPGTTPSVWSHDRTQDAVLAAAGALAVGLCGVRK